MIVWIVSRCGMRRRSAAFVSSAAGLMLSGALLQCHTDTLLMCGRPLSVAICENKPTAASKVIGEERGQN